MGDKPEGYTVHLDGLDGLAGMLGQVATDLSSANQVYTSQTWYQSIRFATVAALVPAALLLTACTGDPGGPKASPTDPATSRPETEIALPALAEAGKATSPYPPSTVTLTVGQPFGVSGRLVNPTAWAWELTSTGDGAVLRRGPDVVTEPCSADAIGCSTSGDQTFVALAPGSTTLTWTFVDRGTCVKASTPPIPRCGSVTKSIQVTVR
ncbi:hypothetical protein ACIRYZ_06345 [Kitasatospora sp. NPDC101155]|uniref:hypothetical protein n=1 Tax=Kitasatospora sp. NPDC101155 TaxID=3364097 RepID=UPI003805E317